MVKYNTPDWQISAFDKDNNSCVKTKPINEKIKELEAAYAKVQETSVKVEDIDMPAFYLKEEPVKEEKDDKVDVLKEYQEMRDRERAEELKRLREEDNKVKFTSVEPLRKDPNRGMRFLKSCSNPINVGKLGSSRSFIKKIDRKYY
jgi:hypothetical protein